MEETLVRQNLWTLLITWGTVQCFVLAPILFFQKSGNQKQRLVLAFILVLIGFQSFNFLFEYFKWYRKLPHLIWINAPFWFLIGPAIYFFQKFSTQKNAGFRNIDMLHFLPFIYAVWYTLNFYLLSGEAKIFWIENFYANYYTEPDYFFYAFITSQFLYGAYAFTKFRQYFKKVGEEYSNAHIYQNRWVMGLLLGFITFWIISLGYNLLLLVDYNAFIPIDYITFLFLTFFVQIFGISAILSPDSFFVTPVSEREIVTKSREVSHLEEEATEVLKFVEENKPYLNPELRVNDLSNMIEIPPYRLSQIINRSTGKNFFEFINNYRVEEVKKRLSDPEYSHLTLDGIARECGFNSSASFYRVFKQSTGVTPKEYLMSRA